MKKSISLFVGLILSITVWGQLFSTTSILNLRERPDLDGQILNSIPKGKLVSVMDEFEGWSKVIYQKDTGYVSSTYLKKFGSDNSLESPVKVHYYTNSAGQKVQSPTYYKTVPTGATAECRDGTYSFSKNHRGTCSHHGGVKRWLK
jgi:uncharacterized protein YgiM (DUF1202 family)